MKCKIAKQDRRKLVIAKIYTTDSVLSMNNIEMYLSSAYKITTENIFLQTYIVKQSFLLGHRGTFFLPLFNLSYSFVFVAVKAS